MPVSPPSGNYASRAYLHTMKCCKGYTNDWVQGMITAIERPGEIRSKGGLSLSVWKINESRVVNLHEREPPLYECGN